MILNKQYLNDKNNYSEFKNVLTILKNKTNYDIDSTNHDYDIDSIKNEFKNYQNSNINKIINNKSKEYTFILLLVTTFLMKELNINYIINHLYDVQIFLLENNLTYFLKLFSGIFIISIVMYIVAFLPISIIYSYEEKLSITFIRKKLKYFKYTIIYRIIATILLYPLILYFLQFLILLQSNTYAQNKTEFIYTIKISFILVLYIKIKEHVKSYEHVEKNLQVVEEILNIISHNSIG